MTSPYTGLADRRAVDRRALPAADASGAHFQRKAAEERADMLADQLADAAAQVPPLEAKVDALHDLLKRIGDLAHAGSTGPAVPDSLWEIRSMAYDGIRSAS